MLKRRTIPSPLRRARQRGIVLVVALVVLVAITIAGISMIRSVDTATLVAGNLAFQQSATRAADKGVEEAIRALEVDLEGRRDDDDPTSGYFAELQGNQSPAAGQTWQEFWKLSLADSAKLWNEDEFGNRIEYVIHRQCPSAGAPGVVVSCVMSPAIMDKRGGQGIDDPSYEVATAVYYRITVRVSGPRRTESYVQAYVTK